jgi:membrane protease YdiL (CAAX protease family)
MEPGPGDYAVSFAVLGICTVSMIVLFRLFQKHIDGRPLLPHEPRRPVPWNGLAALVLLAPLASVWGSLLLGSPLPDPSFELTVASSSAASAAIGVPMSAAVTGAQATATLQEIDEEEGDWLALTIAAQAGCMILLTAGAYAALVLVCGASWRDLGLPADWRQFRSDAFIGFTACVAAMLPVYVILLFLNFVSQDAEQHPLIKELLVNHSPGMMAAAAFTAVVAAPLYEETAFRLVFQGWLEKRFWRGDGELESQGSLLQADVELGDQWQAFGGTALSVKRAVATPLNWPPILISGVLFGLAHLGHGWSPLPLVLLGGVLGYLYQRTHRIVPSMACHFLFNLLTLVMLSLQVGFSP